MQIAFSDEAGEAFQRMVDILSGYNVKLITEKGKAFDAELLGPDSASEGYDAVRYRKLDKLDLATGPELTTRVKRISVY